MVHGLVDAARGVDAGPPGFVREADEVGVGKAVEEFQIRQARPLAVAQVEHRLVGGDRHHARGQDHQVGFEDDVFAQEGVLGGIDQDLPPFPRLTPAISALVSMTPGSLCTSL